jgi:hypothetical protein
MGKIRLELINDHSRFGHAGTEQQQMFIAGEYMRQWHGARWWMMEFSMLRVISW